MPDAHDRKRTLSSQLVENPFVKRHNREWDILTSLRTSVSPPPTSSRKIRHDVATATTTPAAPENQTVNLAAIEAGEAKIRDHLAFFSEQLGRVTRPPSLSAPTPRLSNTDFVDLYRRNQHPHGHHYVIHQHDHPVAGVHYDLRLQISESSSISFAIMYGLPGNPNSKRLNRNATETRVHNLWNHLIETASLSTGSLLIWDTGEYYVLPFRQEQPETDDELSQKQGRKIRLRLQGTKLPKNYTLSLRLPKTNDRSEPPKKPTRRRNKAPRGNDVPSSRVARRNFNKATGVASTTPITTDESQSDGEAATNPATTTKTTEDSTTIASTAAPHDAAAIAHEIAEQEDEQVRLSNAYPGATNTVGSIHQRRWYLSLDRMASGFVRQKKRSGSGTQAACVRWTVPAREPGGVVPGAEGADDNDGQGQSQGPNDRLGPGPPRGFEPFFVRGRDEERSVITGRNADAIMADEGVHGFVGRKGWRPVLE
ncbi:MAG: hypothetical protein M1819_007279 [Sarea resinae]|nr:MAG: hypothetical protein M1819_007279 [Sarea resinae]